MASNSLKQKKKKKKTTLFLENDIIPIDRQAPQSNEKKTIFTYNDT